MSPKLLRPLLLAASLALAAPHAGAEAPTPALATGRVVDGNGKPIAGAVIHLEVRAISATPSRGRTDADGRYAIKLPPLPWIYRAHAWWPITYRDKLYCLRIAPETEADRQNFASRDGGVRNFRWRPAGPVEASDPAQERDSAYYGGTIRLMPSFADGDFNSIIDLQLMPAGPLVDGSAGTAVRRRVELAKSPFVYDIPIGAYTVTATRTRSSGETAPVKLGPSQSAAAAETVLQFQPQQTVLPCGSAADDNGIDRAFLFVVAP